MPAAPSVPTETILITGASAGIGRALSEAWLERGQRVLALQRRISGLGEHPRFSECLADLADLGGLAARVRELLGGITELDRVILNAAIGSELRDIGATPLAALRHSMDVNTWSNKVILDTIFGAGVRVKQVVGISSGAAVRGSRGWNGYALSKAAFAMLVQLYAAERPGTHFCSLAPGVVQTKMQDDLLDYGPEERERFPALQRLLALRGTPDMPLPEVAAVALLEAFDLVRAEPSGSFIDLRTLRRNGSRPS